MWSSHGTVSLVTLLVSLPTTLLKEHEETETVAGGEHSERRLAEDLRKQLMRDNYDYEPSNAESDSREKHEQNAERYATSDAFNQNINQRLFNHINHVSTSITFQPFHANPFQPSHSKQQRIGNKNHPTPPSHHHTRTTTTLKPTTRSTTVFSAPSILDWEPDEVLGDHDLITPFHSHITISKKIRLKTTANRSGRTHHDELKDVKGLFDQKTRNEHWQPIPFGADAFVNSLDRGLHDTEIRETTKKLEVCQQDPNNSTVKKENTKNSNSEHHPENKKPIKEYRKPFSNSNAVVTTQRYVNGEYGIARMLEDTYIPRAHDDVSISPATVEKRGAKIRPAGVGNPSQEHVISKTDLLYYMDDAILAPRDAEGAKRTSHADTAIDSNDTNTVAKPKVYKVLKLSDPSGRRTHGPARGMRVRTFIQEEGSEGVAIAKVDSAPFPEFRLPSGRRQYMLASDPSDLTESSDSSELVDDV